MCYKEAKRPNPKKAMRYFPGSEEQMPLLKTFSLVFTSLSGQYSKQGATGVENLWKGVTNYKWLKTTMLKFSLRLFYFILCLINFNQCCKLDRGFFRVQVQTRVLFYAVKIESLIKPSFSKVERLQQRDKQNKRNNVLVSLQNKRNSFYEFKLNKERLLVDNSVVQLKVNLNLQFSCIGNLII